MRTDLANYTPNPGFLRFRVQHRNKCAESTAYSENKVQQKPILLHPGIGHEPRVSAGCCGVALRFVES